MKPVIPTEEAVRMTTELLTQIDNLKMRNAVLEGTNKRLSISLYDASEELQRIKRENDMLRAQITKIEKVVNEVD